MALSHLITEIQNFLNEYGDDIFTEHKLLLIEKINLLQNKVLVEDTTTKTIHSDCCIKDPVTDCACYHAVFIIKQIEQMINDYKKLFQIMDGKKRN